MVSARTSSNEGSGMIDEKPDAQHVKHERVEDKGLEAQGRAEAVVVVDDVGQRDEKGPPRGKAKKAS